MGILKSDIELLCKQKKNSKNIFNGKTLIIGQQAVYANESDCKKILYRHKIKLFKKFTTNKKTNIKFFLENNRSNFINSNFLFSLFGSSSVEHLDISKYENAEIIWDLNHKIPNKYKNKFDNIVDFGSIEHVFDTQTLLYNYISMLKKNGFLVIATRSSNAIDHGFYSFSPTFFHDFFSINGFKILKTYLIEKSPYYPEEKDKSCKIYEYKKPYLENPIISNKTIDVIVIVKKIKNCKKFYKPIQSFYKKLFTQKTKLNNHKELLRGYKKIFKILISYLPLNFQNIIFSKIRSKYLYKIN